MTIRVLYERFPRSAAGLTFALVISGAPSYAQPNPQALPNSGQQITPLAPTDSRFEPLNPDLTINPGWLATHAATTVVSPDYKTLVVLTSGFNRYYDVENPPVGQTPWDPAYSNEYAFIYDISSRAPEKKQVVQFPNTYHGIVFDPNNFAFYVAGGPSDNIHIVTRSATGIWGEQSGNELALGHTVGQGLNLVPNGATTINTSVGVTPCAAGLAISKDGQTLVVANYYNDSITVFNGGFGNWFKVAELDLRPGKSAANPQPGVAGGEYPFWVAVKGNGSSATVYVSSIRDREIDVVSLLGGVPVVASRIPVKGQPNKMTLNAAQSLLYVAEDQSDTVDIINTATNTIVETIPVIAPLLPSALAQYTGANPNSVALSPDETQLYVTLGNFNSVAEVTLGGTNSGDHVIGLIPTGRYPNSASLVNFPGSVYMYVANGKSATGSDIAWCYGGYGPVGSPNCNTANEWNPQTTKAGLQSFPLPNLAQLSALSVQVFTNNRFSFTESASDATVMEAVRQGIQHVIFIIKENRTYDQILGDLPIGNGDPDLVEFGQAITPNQHNLAQTFVTLDNFMDTAEVSYDGWLWSTAARSPDVVEHQYPVAYAFRGLSLDSEGLNRNVNVAIPTVAGRQAANPFTSSDPDVLPGTTDTAAPDGPNNTVNSGYLWDAAMRAGLTVRSYGFFVDVTLYSTASNAIPVLPNPFSTGTVVAYSTNVGLTPFTDPYFRGFDNALPDFYRYTEWAREFDANYAAGGLPSLSLVRFMHDHTGNFVAGPGGAPPAAIAGVNTPDLMVADNDYAVGLLVQKIANSIYANNTLIFVIEDDAQDGGDHVDSHRSTAYVAGAYVKQGALVSTQYNTLNILRTIEEVLGIPQILASKNLQPLMNLNDALAAPMADIFNASPNSWNFTAVPSAMLYGTQLAPLLPSKPPNLRVPMPRRDARYWARVTKGMDFTDADRLDSDDFNLILWKGMMGNKPYPASPTGLDLRQNRKELLARYWRSLKQKAAKDPKRRSD